MRYKLHTKATSHSASINADKLHLINASLVFPSLPTPVDYTYPYPLIVFSLPKTEQAPEHEDTSCQGSSSWGNVVVQPRRQHNNTP